MCLRIASNMSKPTVGFFSTGARPNLFHTSYLRVIQRNVIRSIHNFSLKSSSVLRKKPSTFQENLCFLSSWAAYTYVSTWCQRQPRCAASNRSMVHRKDCLVTILHEKTNCSNPVPPSRNHFRIHGLIGTVTLLQNAFDAGTDIDDGKDNSTRIPLLRVTKGVDI